uniref:PTI1-like tyrosine-protein kinase n=1 Tax=Populus alba TaxID=43335 RepID=A0A4U5Q7R8_POPAL|nr:PTI1-like tyrosine-protein kinase [Populus alba]
MAFASIFCCVKNSDRKERGKKQPTWRIFSLKELHSATNNFNYDNKLGEGGFGSVYWGQLWDGSQIAVKRLKVWSNKADMEFAVEVEILARVRHKNLLSLRGYCAEGQERLIVYDYMPNLSLLSHLHGQHSSECLLDWKRRMNIAIGSAEGIVATVKRTITEWAQPLACERKFSELADPKLNGKYDEEELKRVVLVSLVCAQNQPERRPTMLDVVELLKGESKERLSELENDELFKAPQAVDYNDGISVAEDSSDFISEEKDANREVKEIVQENTHES